MNDNERKREREHDNNIFLEDATRTITNLMKVLGLRRLSIWCDGWVSWDKTQDSPRPWDT